MSWLGFKQRLVEALKKAATDVASKQEYTRYPGSALTGADFMEEFKVSGYTPGTKLVPH